MATKTPGRPSDKPTPPVRRFDADAVVAEDAKGPFPFTVNGHEYELMDPRDLDYRVAAAAQEGDFMAVLQGALPEAQVYRFFKEKIPLHRFEAICRAYMDHADLGNSPASPTS